MKLVFIVPNINNEGGVARVLSIKINYLIEKLGYEIHIITQNKGNFPLFYNFNQKVVFHDILLNKYSILFLYSYQKQIKNLINAINPKHIIVADNGLKSFFLPFMLHQYNLLLEIHSSLYIEDASNQNQFLKYLQRNLKISLANKFSASVFESIENKLEWKSKNAIVIPNPLWFSAAEKSSLKNKKVIAVARHTYEKGLDRLLIIWSEIIKKHPDWQLEIYGSDSQKMDLSQLASDLQITKNCTFFTPVQNIDTKLSEASIFVLTSRFEAFGMVLIEAMEAGLPCIAYDCPCGPRTIIEDNQNGFLIENGNKNEFVSRLSLLIQDKNLRQQMGKQASMSVIKYDLISIMNQWKTVFERRELL